MSDDMCEIRRELEEQHHSKCSKQWDNYEACGKRLEEAGGSFPGGATCEAWYGDYLKCMDNQIAKKLFAKLK